MPPAISPRVAFGGRDALIQFVVHDIGCVIDLFQRLVQPGLTGIGDKKLVGPLGKVDDGAGERVDHCDVAHHGRLDNRHRGRLFE